MLGLFLQKKEGAPLLTHPLRTRIDVSGLAAGVYFVRVTTEEGVVTKAFVKN